MRVRTLNIIYSIVFITIAALLYWVSFGEEVTGRPISRDPVWYPRVLLLLSVGTGIILLIRGLLNRSKITIPAIRWQLLAVTMAGAGFYLFLFQRIGFIPDTILLISTMSWYLGFRRPLIVAVVAIGFTVLVWYGFNDLLNVTPPGLTLPSIRYGF